MKVFGRLRSLVGYAKDEDMATLRVIAAAAGVHVATASAVLNPAGGNTRVSAETRRRVLEVAKKHSYVPNELARRLRTGSSNVVGFLGGDLRNPYFAELTAALEAELARFNLQMMVSHLTHAEPSVVEKTIASLRQQRVKGIVCWEESVQALPRKKKAGENLLSIGFTRQERPGVWLDLEYAIRSAVNEMVERGFRKLGFFFPKSQRESPSVVARSETFVDVCQKRSLAQPMLASYAGESWDLIASIKGARQILNAHRSVEAWLGFNDIASLGLLRCLPAKSSAKVVCFDGTTLTRCWPGSPTYLDLKIPEFARTVAAAVAGEQDAKMLGRRKNWLRPSLAA
jgi:DNA-binding LacI/PurR family transcriptional regulator